jgi:hypothetical protein
MTTLAAFLSDMGNRFPPTQTMTAGSEVPFITASPNEDHVVGLLNFPSSSISFGLMSSSAVDNPSHTNKSASRHCNQKAPDGVSK